MTKYFLTGRPLSVATGKPAPYGQVFCSVSGKWVPIMANAHPFESAEAAIAASVQHAKTHSMFQAVPA